MVPIVRKCMYVSASRVHVSAHSGPRACGVITFFSVGAACKGHEREEEEQVDGGVLEELVERGLVEREVQNCGAGRGAVSSATTSALRCSRSAREEHVLELVHHIVHHIRHCGARAGKGIECMGNVLIHSGQMYIR